MALMVKDSFLDLERHRQLLESNIEKLQKSLQHWQTWEAEYEGLKEEILAATPPSRATLVDVARGYEAELVTQKEVDNILGQSSRTAAQVVTLLDHRLDYVEHNVKTVQKQLDAAENKLAAATIISTPDVRNEEGLPLTEIVEELDDDGNVISSHLSTPGSVKPQLLEVLKKAGVTDLPSSGSPSVLKEKLPSANLDKEKLPTIESNPNQQPLKPVKKGVKFADDTKDGAEQVKSKTAKKLEELMRIAKKSELAQETPIIPTDESLEDATLRREMLQYGATDIGAVVAELELEEGSDWSEGDYDDTTSTDEEEDQFGRSTKSVLDDDLRQRMIELEEKLGARMLENIGKSAGDTGSVREGIGRIEISGQDKTSAAKGFTTGHDPEEKASTDPKPSLSSLASKKSVRFSENLDISPAIQPIPAPFSASKQKISPISDIVERETPEAVICPPAFKETSKPKSNRAASSRILNGPLANAANASSLPLIPLKPNKPKPFSQLITFTPETPKTMIAPSGPKGMTLAARVVERMPSPNAEVIEPDALDPQLLHQEVSLEYHRMRNRMIQRQGGFMKEEESEIIPLTEEEGGPKKVSRFKAARLARS